MINSLIEIVYLLLVNKIFTNSDGIGSPTLSRKILPAQQILINLITELMPSTTITKVIEN
ncbi:MAG: hypothetical protein WBB28_13325 [Crinalium sp.]